MTAPSGFCALDHHGLCARHLAGHLGEPCGCDCHENAQREMLDDSASGMAH